MAALPPIDEKRRRQRSIAIALTLGGFALLFFFITIAKLSSNGSF